jgi:hypothetical protein
MLAVAAMAAGAIFVALFFPWFHITTSTISRSRGGFEFAFKTGTENAWNTVAVIAALLAVGAVVSASRRTASRLGARRAIVTATVGSVLAVALITFVLIRPPTITQSIGTAGLFTRSIGSLSAHRGVPVDLAWGGFAALGFAVICAAAILSSRIRSGPASA